MALWPSGSRRKRARVHAKGRAGFPLCLTNCRRSWLLKCGPDLSSAGGGKGAGGPSSEALRWHALGMIWARWGPAYVTNCTGCSEGAAGRHLLPRRLRWPQLKAPAPMQASHQTVQDGVGPLTAACLSPAQAAVAAATPPRPRGRREEALQGHGGQEEPQVVAAEPLHVTQGHAQDGGGGAKHEEAHRCRRHLPICRRRCLLAPTPEMRLWLHGLHARDALELRTSCFDIESGSKTRSRLVSARFRGRHVGVSHRPSCCHGPWALKP
mmetsp:Transcript_219/g.788  ORF Transcript_219/g.788 Transcript_219/m.788 type:complete len:267 (+) Transcript_219:6-806(+)